MDDFMRFFFCFIITIFPFSLLSQEILSVDMDNADNACLYQSLESKHSNIVAKKAAYDKAGEYLHIVCSDGHKLKILSRSGISLKEAKAEAKRVCLLLNEETYKLNHLSENVGTMPYENCAD
jgi:hypothetical protein